MWVRERRTQHGSMRTPYTESSITQDQSAWDGNRPFCPGAEWEKFCALLKTASWNSLARGRPLGILFWEDKDLKKGSRTQGDHEAERVERHPVSWWDSPRLEVPWAFTNMLLTVYDGKTEKGEGSHMLALFPSPLKNSVFLLQQQQHCI